MTIKAEQIVIEGAVFDVIPKRWREKMTCIICGKRKSSVFLVNPYIGGCLPCVRSEERTSLRYLRSQQ